MVFSPTEKKLTGSGTVAVSDTGARPEADGGVGPSVADYDLDGDFDLFVANYGTRALYRNDAGKSFTDLASASGINLTSHGVTSAWGDLDNDGRPDF